MPSFLRLPGRTPSSRRSGPRPSEGATSQSRHRPPSLAAAVLGRSARPPRTIGLFSPLTNRRVTRPTGQQATDSCPRSLRPPSSTEKRVGSFGWFRERRSILNRPARRQSRLVPSPTMRRQPRTHGRQNAQAVATTVNLGAKGHNDGKGTSDQRPHPGETQRGPRRRRGLLPRETCSYTYTKWGVAEHLPRSCTFGLVHNS